MTLVTSNPQIPYGLLGPTPTNTVNAGDFGAAVDGTTDDTKAVNDALAYLARVGGGTLLIPPGTMLITGQIVPPYVGTSRPTQVPLRIQGVGAAANSYLIDPPPSGGSVWNMTFAATGNNVAKIQTVGAGLLEICGIKFTDTSTSNTPFIWTTNTALNIHDCVFQGYTGNSGTACTQQAIQLGGRTSAAMTLGGTLPTNGFQGYGTVIRDCWFAHIEIAVGLGGSCNSVLMSNLTVDTTCGSSDAQGAPIRFYGQARGTAGNVVHSCVLEVTNYPYGIAMVDAGTGGQATNQLNVISNVSWWDETATTQGAVYFSAYSTYNTVGPVGYLDTVMNNTKGVLKGPGAASNTYWAAAGFTSLIWGGLTVTGSVRASAASIVAGTGAPSKSFDVGDNTGQKITVIRGGNTSSGDGAAVWFNNGGATRGAVGNYTAYAGGAYTTEIALIGLAATSIRVGSASMVTANVGSLKLASTTTDTLGFYGSTGTSKPTITGSRAGNAAVASLISALAASGYCVDSTTA